MSEKRKSVADSILKGTYNSRNIFSDDEEESIANSIINGTYESKILSSNKAKESSTTNKSSTTTNKNVGSNSNIARMIAKSGQKITDNSLINNQLPTARKIGLNSNSLNSNVSEDDIEKQSNKLARYSDKNIKEDTTANNNNSLKSKNILNSSPAELEFNNVPIVSDKDPRLQLSYKKPWEYNAEDYNNLAQLNAVNTAKSAEMINDMAKTNPVGAFFLNTAMNAGGGMAKTVFDLNNLVNTGGLWITKGIEKGADLLGNEELANKARETYNKRVAEGSYIKSVGDFIPNANQQVDNGFIKASGDVSNVVSNQLTNFMLGGATGIPGSTIQGLEVAGSSAQEVLNENPENLLQASATGALKGYITKELEKMFDANILTAGATKSSIDKLVTKQISKMFKTNTGKEVANRVMGITGENIEEFLEENLGYVIDKLINNKDLPSFEEWWNTTSNTAKTTTLATIVMQLFGMGGESFKNKEIDAQSEFWINEAQKIIDNNKNFNIQLNDSTSNLQQNIPSVQNNSQGQQITQVENKVAQNQNMEQLPVINEANRYIAQIEDTDNLITSAKKYGMNYNDVNLQEIQQALDKRGIKGQFNGSYFKNKDGSIDSNTGALWNISMDESGNATRSIILNPKANENTVVQEMEIHELLHDMIAGRTQEATDLYQDILDYMKQDSNYENVRKQLEDIYAKRYDRNSDTFQQIIDEEVVAKALQTKFGNQEEIHRLVKYNPTKARSIYDKVVAKVNSLFQKYNGDNKLLTKVKEYVFWKNVQNKFEYAYSQDYRGKNINESKFSIQTDNNGNKYVKVDTDQDIFQGIEKKDYNKIAKMYMQDYLMGETQLSDNDITVIDRKSVNKYTNPGKKQQNFDKKMRLTPELRNVLGIAKKDNASLPIKDNSKYKSWEYYKFVFELSGIKFEGTVNIGVDSNGNKHFYEINKIKEVNDISGTSLNRSSTSSITNSIASSNTDVNTTNKYSMQESENNSEISEEAKKQLHRYVGLDDETLNKKISDAIENKQNMLEEANRLRKEYKEFQDTEEFKNAIQDFAHNDNISQQVEDIMNKAQKYADKIRYYDNAYKEYQAQYEAINSILMGNKEDVRSIQDVVKEAEKYFGITNNFKETAYIDINGKQIDFSGKHEGGPSGVRTLDHRQINEIDTDMNTFIEMGNIRILPEGGGINLKIEPNSKQYSKLREYIDSVNGEIYIDIDKANNTYDSAEYRVGTSSSKILSDLQYYFKNGKFPEKSQLADFRYSVEKETFNKYLEKRIGKKGTRTTYGELRLPKAEVQQAPSMANNKLATGEFTRRKKALNPTEISNLTIENADTTPKLKTRKYEKGNKQSSFLTNIAVDSQFLNEDLRKVMSQEENIRYYKGITNEETLENAYKDLQENGKEATIKWFNQDNENATAEDVAKGWILLKQYQDDGDYQSAVEVAKKMRVMGTKAGQTVQAYNILSRLTPEGMFYYVQSELSEVYNKMVEGKSKKWIDENQDKFNLTPEETQFIIEKMESIQDVEDERTKKVTLGEIQKIIRDKIPPTIGKSVKAWMRISMLFNSKTQVRNIAGNATILPVNMVSDVVASGLDKVISKKTGVRTTGNLNLKNYAKGFGKGLYESYDDFVKGINTKNIEGNRFEVSEGKSFKNKGIGKALNRVDNILSFVLDAGDRGFYEATFTNSINNQLVLNKTTEVTQDMIDIATNEALQRTWQDNNAYTQAVLTIRNALNGKIGKHKGMSYGLGDVIIPFAKTPANLTKAIVDYSPVGLAKTLAFDARKFKNSLDNGQYSPQLQHQFVQNLGKATAGTFLYVLGYALASAGIATGEADEDKDVKNFMKNSLGISSYSIKIGDKTFSYDWAQPIATPLAIMTNYVKYSKDNPDANIIDKSINAMNIGTEQLLEQSFMESLNTVLNGNGTTLENLSQAILELPARAIPTLSKQIADMIDGTQRTTFEYNEPVRSAINSVINKIPLASKSLPTSVDTLGNEILKYGGDNNLWNVMFNPANTNKGKLSKAGKEIYDVYMQTGDTTIFPRTAPYYIKNDGEKITMTSEQRSEFQKVTGKYVENTLNGLLNDKDYNKLSNDEKANIINEVVYDSYAKAKYDILKIDSKDYKKLRNTLKNVSTTSYYDYKFKTVDMKKDSEKIEVLTNANYSNKEKQEIYESYIKSSTDEKYDIIKSTFTVNGLNIDKYLEYKLAESNDEFKANRKDNGTVDGKVISGSAKQKRYNYIENIKGATYTQKVILYALNYEPNNQRQKNIVVNYVKSISKNNKEALEILDNFAGVTIYKDGTFDY